MRHHASTSGVRSLQHFQARANADGSPTEAEQSGDRTLPEEVLGVWREMERTKLNQVDFLV